MATQTTNDAASHPVLRHGWDDIISPLLKNADFLHFFALKFAHVIFLQYFCSRKRLLSACGSLPASGCIPFLLVAIQRYRGKAERKS